MLLSIIDELNQKKIVLASGSENRKQMLQSTGLTNFIVSPSNFEENLPKEDFKTSVDYVIMTSKMKLLDKLKEY